MCGHYSVRPYGVRSLHGEYYRGIEMSIYTLALVSFFDYTAIIKLIYLLSSQVVSVERKLQKYGIIVSNNITMGQNLDASTQKRRRRNLYLDHRIFRDMQVLLKANLVPRTFPLAFGLSPQPKSRGRGPGNEVDWRQVNKHRHPLLLGCSA